MRQGLVLCGFTVLFWALYALYARYAAAVWAVEPLVFASLATLVAGATLLAIAGPGDLGLETFRKPHTWAYGLLDVVGSTLSVGACFFATATELVLLLRVDVIFGLALAWAVFGRRHRTSDRVGGAVILLGCALTAAQMASDKVWPAVLLIALASLVRASITVVAELHPTSRAADTLRKRCRITGLIMLVSAGFFLLAVGAAALAREALDPALVAAHPAFDVLPRAERFLDPATILAAIGLGALIYAPATYFYFYASRTAGTETFFMMLVYQPVITIVGEQLLGTITPLPPSGISLPLLAAMLCILGGSTFMLWARHQQRTVPPVEPQPASE